MCVCGCMLKYIYMCVCVYVWMDHHTGMRKWATDQSSQVGSDKPQPHTTQQPGQSSTTHWTHQHKPCSTLNRGPFPGGLSLPFHTPLMPPTQAHSRCPCLTAFVGAVALLIPWRPPFSMPKGGGAPQPRGATRDSCSKSVPRGRSTSHNAHQDHRPQHSRTMPP